MNLKQELERVSKGLRALRLYRQCVRPGQLCFDIGANKGSRTVIFTLLGGRTVALEPNRTLTGTIRRLPRVVVEHKAVSNTPGTRVFLQNANDQISSLNPDWMAKWPEFGQWTRHEVECTTLDELIGRHGLPDFCKIDVEGHEVEVLEGLSRAIPLLSFETAPDFIPNAERCLDRLAPLGDYEFNFSAGDEFRWASPRWVDRAGVLELIRKDAGDIYARLKRQGAGAMRT